MYWAQALAEQTEGPELQSKFSNLAKQLSKNEQQIIEELNGVQGKAVDIGGYFLVDKEKTSAVMRPSAIFNSLLESGLG